MSALKMKLKNSRELFAQVTLTYHTGNSLFTCDKLSLLRIHSVGHIHK